MCGIPAPVVQWKFDDGVFRRIFPIPINKFTFKYSIELPKLDLENCGKDLVLEATNQQNNIGVRRVWRYFSKYCKYNFFFSVLEF